MAYGNPNVAGYDRVQYLTVDDSSDSVTLSPKCRAFSVFATSAMWVKHGRGAQTAAAPGAEKTAVDNLLFVPSGVYISAVKIGGDDTNAPVVAAIQSTAGGTLYVYEHFEF